MILVLLFYIIRRARMEFNRTVQQCNGTDSNGSVGAGGSVTEKNSINTDTVIMVHSPAIKNNNQFFSDTDQII